MKKQILFLSLVVFSQNAFTGTSNNDELVEVKEFTNMVGQHPRFFEKFILKFKKDQKFKKHKCAVLYGPPGNGKTTYSRELARALDCNYINVSCCDIVTKWQGSGSSNIHKLTLLIQNGYVEHSASDEWIAPVFAWGYDSNKKTIVNLDEFDVMFEPHNNKSEHNRECVAALIKWLDELVASNQENVFIFCTTNYIEKIPKEILDRILRDTINILLPGKNMRMFLFKKFLSEQSFKEPDFKKLVSISDGMSSRGIKIACEAAIEDSEIYGKLLTRDFLIEVLRDIKNKEGQIATAKGMQEKSSLTQNINQAYAIADITYRIAIIVSQLGR